MFTLADFNERYRDRIMNYDVAEGSLNPHGVPLLERFDTDRVHRNVF